MASIRRRKKRVVIIIGPMFWAKLVPRVCDKKVCVTVPNKWHACTGRLSNKSNSINDLESKGK